MISISNKHLCLDFRCNDINAEPKTNLMLYSILEQKADCGWTLFF